MEVAKVGLEIKKISSAVLLLAISLPWFWNSILKMLESILLKSIFGSNHQGFCISSLIFFSLWSHFFKFYYLLKEKRKLSSGII
jgi:hypothetical protein